MTWLFEPLHALALAPESAFIQRGTEGGPIHSGPSDRPKERCPVPGGENQIALEILNADTESLTSLLNDEAGRKWLSYCMAKEMAIEPPYMLNRLFLLITLLQTQHPLTEIFYDAFDRIDPAKAGLITLHLLEVCKSPMPKQVSSDAVQPHAQRLQKVLSRIAATWKLDPHDTPTMTVYCHALLRDTRFLEQLVLYAETTDDSVSCLRSEDLGPVVEIAGDTLANIARTMQTDETPAHLRVYFPDDMIPTIERLLKNDFFPLRALVSAELQRRKGLRCPQPEIGLSNFVSLYGFVISRSQGKRPLWNFMRECVHDYATKGIQGASFLPEGIIASHHGMSVLLLPDLKKREMWPWRRSPYRVMGFVQGEDLFPLEKELGQRVQDYLASLPPSELVHRPFLPDDTHLVDPDTFLRLATKNRGEEYAGHDAALENEVTAAVNRAEGPVSIVDVGMGGGQLLQRLHKKFAGESRVRCFGAEREPKALALAKLRLPETVRVSPVRAQKLSRADFASDLEGTHKIAVLEGVLALGVTYQPEHRQILEELCKMGFDEIFITGNTPVTIYPEELQPLLEKYRFTLQRTLYPGNLFNHNSPKIMFVLARQPVAPTPGTTVAQEGPHIPLEIKGHAVERPALVERDEDFWARAQAANPGILDRVQKILGTYLDETTEPLLPGAASREPLKEGVDYDLFSGRSLIIRLETPVDVRGILMKELVLKGATFKKSREGEAYIPDRYASLSTEERELSGTIETSREGIMTLVPKEFDRLGGISYEKTKTEYVVGRVCFRDVKSGVKTLPVMNVRYTKDKGSAGLELGVVVLASPAETRHIGTAQDGQPLRNRVGHILGIMLEKCQATVGTPEYEDMKTRLYKDSRQLSAGFGIALRNFHDAGYTHGNPHSGNALLDLQTDDLWMGDLSEARVKSTMTEEQAYGYQLLDLYFATLDFLYSITSSPDPEVARYTLHNLRYFLVGYLGTYGIYYEINSEEEALRDVQVFHEACRELYQNQDPWRRRISSPVLARTTLARMLAQIVFNPQRERLFRRELGLDKTIADMAPAASL